MEEFFKIIKWLVMAFIGVPAILIIFTVLISYGALLMFSPGAILSTGGIILAIGLPITLIIWIIKKIVD